MTISKKTLEFTFGIDSRESGTNLWSKMRTTDYDPHGGHVIMAVRPFWDEGLIQWLPCWWWGTLKKLQLPQCGGWFVGLFVVQMASMKIKIRYDGLHRPKKNTKQRHWKQHPRITMPSTKDLTVLLKKRKNKSIWTTTSKKTQTHRRRPGFQVPPWSDAIVSLPWSTRSRPPRLFVEVNPSEKTKKN